MLFVEGDVSGARNEYFLAAGWDSPNIYRVSPKGLAEGAQESIHGGGNKQDERNRNIFGKMRDTRGIIQIDNSAGHCFVLRDLITLNVLISRDYESENMHH